MLWTMASLLAVLRLPGLMTSCTLDGFIHRLLVIALVVAVLGLLQGRGAPQAAPPARSDE